MRATLRRKFRATALLGMLTMVGLAHGADTISTSNTQGLATTSKPIRMVVASAAGGILDTVGRTIAQGITQRTGQQVIVENKPGAGGIIGTEIVAKAAPDGETIGKIATSHAINPAVYAKLPYDTMRDLAPVSQTVNITNVLVVQRSLPANNLSELIALARQQPGKLSFGSAGVGQSNHFSGEMLKQMAGIDLMHVPYKGSAPAMTDLLSGNITMMFVDALSSAPHVGAGKLKVIAATGLQRSAAFPQYPTLNESGLPGFNGNSWLGIVAPGGTPPAALNRLSGEVAAVLNSPEVRNKLISQGIEPVGSTPEAFKAFIETEMKNYAQTAKAAGITAQ